jgi:membrane protease YdiL (CAAX protease family)
MLRFFSLTYAVTWTCFVVSIALSGNSPSFVASFSVLRTPLLIIGTFAPSLVALGLTARAEGAAGVKALLRRTYQWPSTIRWYLFAVGYLAAIKLAVVVIHRLLAGAWPRFGTEPWYLIAAAIVISTPVQAGEEIGWRGYALPRLAARIGLPRASLLLGLVWACWHLPLFFVPGLNQYGQSFPLFALGGIALSVAIAWLYAHTEGSIGMAMLMHSAVNQTTGIVPASVPDATNPFALSSSLAGWLFVVLLWMSAAYFLVEMPDPEVRAGDQNTVAG